MKSWILRTAAYLAALYLSITKALAVLYLAAFVPLVVVAEFMRLLGLGHVRNGASENEAIMVAIVLTIFLLVLKVVENTEEIKKRLSGVGREEWIRKS